MTNLALLVVACGADPSPAPGAGVAQLAAPPPMRADCPPGGGVLLEAELLPSLQAALDAAEPGARVVVCGGRHGGPFVSPVPVVVGGVGEVVLFAERPGTVLSVPAGSQVLDLRLTGGDAPLGGGLRVDGPGEVVVARVVAEGNRADVGGGLAFTGAQASLFDVLVDGNAAELGGGLSCTGGDLRIDGGTIRRNRATHGGGVYAESCSVDGGTVRDNVATDDGGGLALLESSASGVEVLANRARWGGGLYAMGSELARSVVIGNAAPAGAGVFAISGVTLEETSVLDHAGVGIEVGTDRVDVSGGAVLGNEIGAASQGDPGQVLSVRGADWGDGGRDNEVDLVWGRDTFALGPDATVVLGQE